MDDILFYTDSRTINQFEPLGSQCRNNDVLRLRRIFLYKIVWKGRRTSFRYFTNVTYSNFITQLLTFQKIPQEAFPNYRLQIGDQTVNTSFLFPVSGISEDIYVMDNQGMLFSRSSI